MLAPTAAMPLHQRGRRRGLAGREDIDHFAMGRERRFAHVVDLALAAAMQPLQPELHLGLQVTPDPREPPMIPMMFFNPRLRPAEEWCLATGTLI